MNFPVYRLAKLVHPRTQVYFYKFSYRGNFTYFSGAKHKCDLDNHTISEICERKNFIVEHNDDLHYIFTSKNRQRIIPIDGNEDAKIVKQMTTIISNFAKFGYRIT